MDSAVADEFDALVAYLTDGYWHWSRNVDGGMSWDGIVLDYHFAGDWNAAQRDSLWASLEVWADVATVDFVESVDGQADITFFRDFEGTDGPYAYSRSWYVGNTILRNEVHFNADRFDVDAITAAGSYERLTVIHELGHSLGLGHPGPYDGADANDATDVLFTTDTRAHTVMSYWNASKGGADHRGRYAETPLLYDVAAIQAIWGADTETRRGDTVYGFDTAGLAGARAFAFTPGVAPVVAIWDGGGVDTLNLSGFEAAAAVDLTPGTLSDVGGGRANLAVAVDTWLENLVGGGGDDHLAGNERANVLTGGPGADRLDGGAGRDTVAVATAEARWLIDLATGTAANRDRGDVDRLISIERAVAGPGPDRLFGGAGADDLEGGAGADFLRDRSGADTVLAGPGDDHVVTGPGTDAYDGGPGTDVLDFGHRNAGYRVDLAAGTVDNRRDGSETAAGFEHVEGGLKADRLVGDGGANRLVGNGGDDVLRGRAGDDRLEGGPGDDELFGQGGLDLFVVGIGHDVVRVDFQRFAVGTDRLGFAAVTGLVAFGDLDDDGNGVVDAADAAVAADGDDLTIGFAATGGSVTLENTTTLFADETLFGL